MKKQRENWAQWYQQYCQWYQQASTDTGTGAGMPSNAPPTFGGERPRPRPQQQQQQQQQQQREPWTQLGGSAFTLAAAAEEAEALRHFCAEALEALAEASAEVLTVFAAFTTSFEKEITSRCTALAEAHFATDHHDALRAVRCGRADNSALQKVVAAATSFIDMHFRRGSNLCYCWLGLALERLIVARWFHQFRRSPPKPSSKEDVIRFVAADEKVLKTFAAHFRSEEGEDVLRPVAVLRAFLSAPDEERQQASAHELCQLLGDAHGRALTKAAQLAILH